MSDSIQSVLNGKTALITGATGGIGNEIAKQLHHHGTKLFLTGRNPTKLQGLKNDFPEAKVYQLDLSSGQNVEEQNLQIEKDSGGIDILINCAGIFYLKPLEELVQDDYHQVFSVNIQAPIFLAKWHSRNMKQKRWGRIFNIGSSSCYNGGSNSSLYCASKHALLGFSRSLSKELKDFNIRVCNLSPSSTKTEMGKIPLASPQDYNTFIDPKEVAEVLVFLCGFNNSMEIQELLLNRVHVQ